jgi:hypothetical protein
MQSALSAKTKPVSVPAYISTSWSLSGSMVLLRQQTKRAEICLKATRFRVDDAHTDIRKYRRDEEKCSLSSIGFAMTSPPSGCQRDFHRKLSDMLGIRVTRGRAMRPRESKKAMTSV